MKKLILISALTLSACGASDMNAFQKACIETMKERLKAPSTFKLIEFTDLTAPITFDSEEIKAMEEQLEQMGDPSALEEMDRLRYDQLWLDIRGAKNNDNGTLFEAILEYEAQNAYGTPLRDSFQCEYEAIDESFNGSVHSVRVNGKKHLDWLVDQIP